MSFRSSAITSSVSGGALTATPAGVALHDFLASWYQIDGTVATQNLPAGWTQRAQIHFAGATPDGGRMWYADKDDATGTDSFQFSDSNGDIPIALMCAAWSGRDNAAPRSTTPVTTQDTNSNASPVSATINGITALAGDDICIFLGGDQTAAAGRWTFSTITDYTERQDGVATDWVSAMGLQTRDAVSGGATGNFSTTITNSGAGNIGYSAIVVAIKAPGEAPTGNLRPQACL